MSELKEFPYETRLNVLHPPLEVIDEKALANTCTYKWYNQTLCAVNDCVVRLGVWKATTTGKKTKRRRVLHVVGGGC
jgi:hypothetical protein